MFDDKLKAALLYITGLLLVIVIWGIGSINLGIQYH